MSISTLGAMLSNRDLTEGTMEKTQKIQAQASSGTKGTLQMENPGGSSRVDQNNTEIIYADSTLRNETERSVNLGLAATAIDGLVSSARKLQNLAVSANDVSAGDAYRSLVQLEIDNIQKFLNQVDLNGNYLFGGTDITTKPADLSLMASSGIGSSPSKSYYKGNAVTDQSTHLILASDDSIAGLIHGALMARDGVSIDDRAEAQKIIRESLKQITEGPATIVRIEQDKIKATLDQTAERRADLDQAVKEEVGVNIFSAITEANQQKLQLQVSFMTSQMTLNNLQQIAQQFMRG